MMHRSLLFTSITLTLVASALQAQSSIKGRVVFDSATAVAGAEVVLNGPQNSQRTNERGEFTFTRIAGGFHIIGIRMLGFVPLIDTIEVEDAGEIVRTYRLTRSDVTKLPEVPVTTTPLDQKLTEFHERRKGGVGRFLDSAQFANARGTRTSDRLAKLSGVTIQRGRGSEVFVTNGRVRRPGEPGARSMCRAMVWLDGVNLGIEYNVNQLDPSSIAAVEWYASNLTVPAKLAGAPRFAANATTAQHPVLRTARGDTVPKTESYCGVLVIWLR